MPQQCPHKHQQIINITASTTNMPVLSRPFVWYEVSCELFPCSLSQGHGTTSGTLTVPILLKRMGVCLEMGYTVGWYTPSYGYGMLWPLYIVRRIHGTVGKKVIE
jgi:hypothetical protein